MAIGSLTVVSKAGNEYYMPIMALLVRGILVFIVSAPIKV